MRGDIKLFSGPWNHWNRWGHWWQHLLLLIPPFSQGLDGLGVIWFGCHHLLFSILDLAFSSSPEGFEEGAYHEVSYPYLAPLYDLQCYCYVPILHVYQDAAKVGGSLKKKFWKFAT